MSTALVIVVAVLTYASRACALVLMPQPPLRLRMVLDRIPAPLFAALAALSLIDEGSVAPATTLWAAAGALVAAPTRSLLWVLAGGLIGYAVGEVVFS